MPNSIVKLLGDSVYSLESAGVGEQQRGGLGKLSYGLRTEAIVEEQRGGLGKLSYAGANPLAKMSIYGEDELTFGLQQMPSMNFADKTIIEVHKPNLIQRFRNQFGQYAVAGAPRPSSRRPPRTRAPARRTAPPPRRTAPPPKKAPPRPSARRRVHLSKQTPYPPDTQPWKPAPKTSAMALPQNRGIVKTSQIETGLPRTKQRQGQVAKTPAQVERASEGRPVGGTTTQARPRRILPKGWLFNIVKIFDM